MGINAQTFGNGGNATRGFAFGNSRNDNQRTAAEDRPKAEFWLNIGYVASTVLEGEDEPRFISLPAGIPLDTTKPVEVRGQNEIFRAMCSAQNDLLSSVIDEAKKLAPGQSIIIGDPDNSPLVLQLRRVAQQETITPSENVFGSGRKLALVS